MLRSSSSPRAAVLILHLSGVDDTRACLRSLLADGEADKEILLLDNGSQGNDADVLQAEFGSAIRIVRSPVNLGYAGGNNLLATHTNAEFLVFLNNDTEVAPGWIVPLITTFTDKSVGACQPKIRSLYDRSLFDYAGGTGGFLDALGFPYIRGRVFETVEEDIGQYDVPVDLDWVSGAAFAMRRQLFTDCGGFDARLFAYMEEIDLSWRLRRSGYRLRCAPSSLVFHKGGRTMRNRLARKRYWEHRNNLLILVKNLPLTRLLWVLPARLLLEAAATLYYFCSGRWTYVFAPARSSFAFVRMSPRFFRTRSGTYSAVHPKIFSIAFQYFVLRRRTWRELHRSCDDSSSVSLTTIVTTETAV